MEKSGIAMVGLCLLNSGMCLCLGSSYSYAEVQRGIGANRIHQLLADVQKAMPGTKLTTEKKTRLLSDVDGIRSALRSDQQGEPVDRQRIASLIADMQTLVDSGAFAKTDQAALDHEFALLRQW